jgi:hypothetical protein
MSYLDLVVVEDVFFVGPSLVFVLFKELLVSCVFPYRNRKDPILGNSHVRTVLR